MKSGKLLAYTAWVMVCILWGATYVAIRAGVQDLPPILFAGLRFLPAGIIMVAWRRAVGIPWPKGREWIDLIIPGLLLLVIGNGCLVYSEQVVPGGIAALIVALTPLWMVTLVMIKPKGERITPMEIIGILIGFGGLVLLIWPQLNDISAFKEYLHGVLLLVFASMLWAAGSLYIARHRVKCGPLMGAGVQTLSAGIILTIVGTLAGEWPQVEITSTGMWSLAYLIIGGSVMGYGAYVYALSHLPIGLVSTYAYVNPVVALFLGVILLNEVVDGRTILATCIILSGVALVNKELWPWGSRKKTD